MIGQLSIRNKLRIGLGAMLFSVVLLFGAAMFGLYSYRGLVKSLAARSVELPMADQLSQHVGDLQVIIAQARERKAVYNDSALQLPDSIIPSNADVRELSYVIRDMRRQFEAEYDHFGVTLERYREQLAANDNAAGSGIGDDRREKETLEKIDTVRARVEQEQLNQNWLLNDPASLEGEVEQLRALVSDLPSHLHNRLHELSGDVASRYRLGIFVACVTCFSSVGLMVWGIQFFRQTVDHPLQHLVRETRLIANDNFKHRIEPLAEDEIGELAEAMNAMTIRFCDIRDDLDAQVQLRSKEVVRSEQLASVGYLAAGVAHEINNPLSTIAFCSESLESRIRDLIPEEGNERPDWEIVSNYLEMIQREAFRCKAITEKLLDFSRMGDSQRHATELRDLVSNVIEMVQHLGRYNSKTLELLPGDPVVAEINPQEIKQVVLNLLTNGLDSVGENGAVKIDVERHEGQARVVVVDNGCGLNDEVKQHLFDPFFTRRRDGQGTGLGLSISYRIVQEHGGSLTAESDGPDQGSKFIVSLPHHSNPATQNAA